MKNLLFLIIVFFVGSALFAQSTSFSLDVTADDYAEETNSDGSMYLTSSDLELCYDGHMQTVGIHFSSVTVPQGTTISSSYIQFQADESQSGTSFTITIKAQDADNPATFSSTDYDVTSRTTTTASVSWNPSAWSSGDAGSAQRSPDISSIIQEIVNRSGWSSGNSMVIIITANTGSSSNHRTAETDPVLHIEYSADAEDVLYYVSDDDDELYKVDVNTGTCELIGGSGFSSIEAIANWPSQSGYTLYATDAGIFGTLSFTTGAFTSIGQVDGGGTADGSDGPQSLNDVDGLAFDARTGILWASNRRSGSNYDLLFQIDPSTGQFVPDAFGSGVDYLVIDGSGVRYDIDDIAISPVDGKMYCTNNDGGSNDELLEINKATGAVSVASTFQTISDVEGADFGADGTFYVSSGNGNSLHIDNTSTGVTTDVKDPLCGSGDVEALATLVREANKMSGNLWEDTDKDGIKDAGETTGIANVHIKIYYDANGNGSIDGSDEYLNYTTTDASGDWSFEYATTGYLIATVDNSTLPSGYALTTSNIQTAHFTGGGQTDSGNDFGANTDSDCDGDGIPDFADGNTDSDGDGVNNKCDLDSDNDGILDSEEGTEDTDGDGVKDYLDLDSDNDGIPDAIEANNGVAPTGYNSSTGRITGSDSDSDGLLNSVDNDPSTAYGSGSTSTLDRKDHDGDGVKDFVDRDSDNDGILDIIEAGGSDSDGDGMTDSFTDSNSDGYHDSYTSSPLTVPNTDSATEAVALPDYIDQDSDGDGIDDLQEGLATCGIDTPCFSVPSNPADADGDGILNDYDISEGGTPVTPYDKDSDGTPDYIDSDSDDDSYSDRIEGDDANNDQVADSSPAGSDSNENGIDDTFDNNCSGVTNLSFSRYDYAEETNSDGSMYLTSSDLEFCYDGHLQTVGIHYNAVNIPQGATITSAYIQFQVDETSSGSVSVTIHGEDADNASTFSSTAYDVTSRTQTSASVTWSIPDWTTVGDEGTDQRSADISSIVQEIVNRSGWSSGNNLVIIISGTNTSVHRTAENDPVLHVSYSGGMSYACGTSVPVQDNDGDGEADFRDDTDDSGGLPIKLSDLDAVSVNRGVELSWVTLSEINNEKFVIQRSKNGSRFEVIGEVTGAGNSNQVLHYEFLDGNPYKGINYYRLKQVDFDGSIHHSKVVSVKKNKPGGLMNLFPNPARSVLHISTSETGEITVTTLNGQTVKKINVRADSDYQLDISDLPAGIYTVTFKSVSAIEIKKLVIH